ncbi:MAG TPA: hypothetical protein VIH94_04085 [Candidatus Limnocylindrales bacterium]|jgi:hypothetical protein
MASARQRAAGSNRDHDATDPLPNVTVGAMGVPRSRRHHRRHPVVDGTAPGGDKRWMEETT